MNWYKKSQLEDNYMLEHENYREDNNAFDVDLSSLDPETAYEYLFEMNLNEEEIPKEKKDILENIISQDPVFSYRYAFNILGKRFLLGEPAIAQILNLSFLYAKELIGGSFKLGEPIIATDAYYAYTYAREVIGERRFKLGELSISKSSHYSYYYAVFVVKGRFGLGEKVIATDPQFAYLYAMNVMKGRFPRGEKTILNSKFKDSYLQFIASKGLRINELV